jgi:predicted Zn-ribbon and HTH transcriptional regulator
MGDLIKPICSCGYESEQMKQGIGFKYIETGVFYEPAFCDNCGIVEERDASEKSLKCVRCKGRMPYYKTLIKARAKDRYSGFPNTDYINKRLYWHCPKCKEQSLQFLHEGMWD